MKNLCRLCGAEKTHIVSHVLRENIEYTFCMLVMPVPPNFGNLLKTLEGSGTNTMGDMQIEMQILF